MTNGATTFCFLSSFSRSESGGIHFLQNINKVLLYPLGEYQTLLESLEWERVQPEFLFFSAATNESCEMAQRSAKLAKKEDAGKTARMCAGGWDGRINPDCDRQPRATIASDRSLRNLGRSAKPRSIAYDGV
jgi:hypothetical protein